MDLIEPIKFLPLPVDNAAAKKNQVMDMDNDYSFNSSFFMSDGAVIEGKAEPPVVIPENKPAKRTRSATTVVPVSPEKKSTTEIVQDTTIPYLGTFDEPANIQRSIVMQVDQLASEIKTEIDTIRASKSMKGKYTYLSNMTSAISSLISTKQSAATQLERIIKDAHDLELKRSKDLKEAQMAEKNDDARMMDMYSAFIHTPMGMYDNALHMPTVPEMMLGPNDPNQGIHGVSMGGQHNVNMSPEQMRIRMEANTNIEEVVMYEPSTGRRWFEVIDKSTGQPIPNYPKSDQFLLEDTSIDVRAGIAKNRNLDRVWPLHTVGQASMTEY